jgi:hypothetical protein
MALRLEDDSGGYPPGLDVGDRVVDLFERTRLADDSRPPGRVQVEDSTQIFPRTDD